MATFTVTTLLDDGSAGSLRQIIANLSGNGNTIEFAPELEGTITLNGSEIVITNGVTIKGDGRITIDGNDQSRIFQISNPTSDFTAVLDGLTLQNGRAEYDSSDPENSRGGAILTKENLTITNSQIINNSATGSGNDAGAIFSKSGGGVPKELIIKDSVISGNTADGDAGGIRSNGGIVTIEDSVIVKNTAGASGDAIQLNDGAVGSAEDSTVFGSVANASLTDNGNNLFDNDPDADLPTVDISVSSPTGSEQDTSEITVTATASDSSGGPKTVQIVLSGTGVDSNDFVSIPTEITIPSGQTSASVTLQISDDDDIEGDETVTVSALNPLGADLGSSPTDTFTIIDNDQLPEVTLTADMAVEEGNTVTFTATASEAVTTDQTIDVTFDANASTTKASELGSTLVTITIEAGETVGTATINTIDDSVDEADETATFNYAATTAGITLGNTSTTTTVQDNDSPPVPTEGEDILNGSDNADFINGLGGDDTINGFDGNDNLNGGAGNDILNGGAGNDILAGIAGNNIMSGGTGNDVYIVNSDNDIVIEEAGEGLDWIFTAVFRDLSVADTNVENLKLINGQGDINGTGSDIDNRMHGNEGNNILSGLGGNDLIEGFAGNDTLIGGSGIDRLVGGEDDDIFQFNSLDDGRDTVQDFGVGNDVVDVSNLLQSVGYTGTDAVADGFLRLVSGATDSYVQIDADGFGTDSSFVNVARLFNYTGPLAVGDEVLV